MEFRGDDLLDAFAKVFDRPIGPYDRLGNKKSSYRKKPSSYGKPGSSGGKYPKYGSSVSTGSKYPKTQSGGKYGSGRYGPKQASDDGEENPHATSQAIAAARAQAVLDAEHWIANADVREGAEEVAIIYIYNKRDGTRRELTGDQAGYVDTGGGSGSFRSSSRHFTFRYTMSRSREVVLATAHSHPAANRAGGWQMEREADRLNGMNEHISRNGVDKRLQSIAPVIIKTPLGFVKRFERAGGYE